MSTSQNLHVLVRVALLGLALGGAPARALGAPAGPRLIAPISTARVSCAQPVLRWEQAGGGSARVEICRDRACAQIIQTLEAQGSSATPPQPLPPGVAFWRVRSAAGVSATWQLTVGHRAAPVCTTLGLLLDVNGDGFADVLLGQAIHLGGPAGLQAEPAAVLADRKLQIVSGAGAGDVNGDGYSDLIAAAPKAHKVYVFYGGPKGLNGGAAQPDATLEAPEKTGTFGEGGLAGVGDVNGDGYSDVVVGAPGLLKAYVYLGGPAGLSAQPAQTLRKASRHEHSGFGAAVLGPGDVNGDGFADFLVLAPGPNDIYGFHGGAQGPAPEPAFSLFGGGDTQASSRLSAAGDTNGDGYADVYYSMQRYPEEFPRWLAGGPKGLHQGDLKIKLPYPEVGSEPQGEVTQNLQGAGDLDGDGFDDAFLEFSDGEKDAPLYLFYGGPAGLKNKPVVVPVNGRFHVIAPGDVNGDGFADLLVSRYRYDGDRHQEVSLGIQLYLGGPKGLQRKPSQVIPPPRPARKGKT